MEENNHYESSRQLSCPPGVKWPFRYMQVGDRVTVKDCSQHDNASASYKYSGKKYGMKFTRKTVGSSLIVERIS